MNTDRWPRPATSVPLALALLLASAAPLGAQIRPRPNRPSAPPPRQPRRPPEPGIQERSFILRQLEKQAQTPPKPEAVSLALAQIGEDYERVQVINNRMMAAVMSAPAPDYRLIAETTGELRRRAERLRLNLALPKGDGAEGARAKYQPPADGAQMKAALLLLDRSLMSFVRSPVFKNIEVVEAAAATRAGRDLDDVIELSRRLVKDAGRLGKGAGSR